MADLEVEKSYSGFERFMFFLTPILFTLVLLGVLLTLFNPDLRNKMLEIGNSVPILSNVLPDPPAAEQTSADNEIRSSNAMEKVAELEALITAKELELSQALSSNAQQEQLIKDLESQIEQLKLSTENKLLDDQEYQNHIQGLANMYAQIAPNKAAPILQSMQLEEMVLILNAMRPEDRVRVMEKMNPRIAADATMLMKDLTPAKDQQIAALQARLDMQGDTSTDSSFLDTAQLNATFSTMAPASAAELLLKMSEISQAKVLKILNSVANASRSAILAEMSNQNKDLTAQLVAKLMNN